MKNETTKLKLEEVSRDLKIIYQDLLNLMSTIISCRTKLKVIKNSEIFDKNLGTIATDNLLENYSKISKSDY